METQCRDREGGERNWKTRVERRHEEAEHGLVDEWQTKEKDKT